jgi:hypothetical protein
MSADESRTSTPAQRSCSSSSNGARKTSIFFDVGESFPENKRHSLIKNFFVSSHSGKLYNMTIIGTCCTCSSIWRKDSHHAPYVNFSSLKQTPCQCDCLHDSMLGYQPRTLYSHSLICFLPPTLIA